MDVFVVLSHHTDTPGVVIGAAASLEDAQAIADRAPAHRPVEWDEWQVNAKTCAWTRQENAWQMAGPWQEIVQVPLAGGSPLATTDGAWVAPREMVKPQQWNRRAVYAAEIREIGRTFGAP